jgi:NTP pyrophosphatase (non-canonical NTP hydrolase)
MKQLINRNYKSIQKRGLITSKTSHVDFYHKLVEETKEVKAELNGQINMPMLKEEITDVILTCLNWLRHYDENPENELLKKIEKNENR